MKRLNFRLRTSALALAAALIGTTAISIAQTSRRSARPNPEARLRADPNGAYSAYDSRDLHSFIDDLESSPPDDIRTGRIGRFFTNPAVIITDGRMHQIDWDRIRDNNDSAFPVRSQRDTQNTEVRIENFETHRIDPNTVVVMYTAVQPEPNGGSFRQPVCATLVRTASSRGWRVASYTAEDAAIPGSNGDDRDREPLPLR
jgi:hypothetical protein